LGLHFAKELPRVNAAKFEKRNDGKSINKASIRNTNRRTDYRIKETDFVKQQGS
jgi:hypothetical protein